jgi:hypothetical protein
VDVPVVAPGDGDDRPAAIFVHVDEMGAKVTRVGAALDELGNPASPAVAAEEDDGQVVCGARPADVRVLRHDEIGCSITVDIAHAEAV